MHLNGYGYKLFNTASPSLVCPGVPEHFQFSRTLSVPTPKLVFKVIFTGRRNESAGRAAGFFGSAFFSPSIFLAIFGITGMILPPR